MAAPETIAAADQPVNNNHSAMGFRTDNWQERLDVIVQTMREMSTHRDPQQMVQQYARRMRSFYPADRFLSLSRRKLNFPQVRITRFSGWEDDVNPWKSPERLPVISGGILADLIYGNEPVVLGDVDIPPTDPAFPYLGGHRSLRAIPLFDQGESLNMVIGARVIPNAFPVEDLPELVWVSNLFGRATQNLVLAEERDNAYRAVDREMKVVGEIQHTLLPREIPDLPGLSIAAYYRTSQRAGGDYYDFFPLPHGRLGLLIADVSGHGTPAAVLMAMTRTIAHTFPHDTVNEHGSHPEALLTYLNSHLSRQYTAGLGAFVTAFYGIYNPANRSLTYSSAGHNPPRVKRCGNNGVFALEKAGSLPLGISEDVTYQRASHYFTRGDRIIIYTDGIVEAPSPSDELFGDERLDLAAGICQLHGASSIVESVVQAVADFTQVNTPIDDQTMIVAEIS